MDSVQRTDKSWVNLVNGVLAQLAGKTGGINLSMGGNISSGVGVSSSAAIFGGCVLAMAKDAEVNEVLKPVEATYKKAFNIKLDNIPLRFQRAVIESINLNPDYELFYC